MSQQVQKPQNKNITVFKQKQCTFHEREQIDIRRDGDTSNTKRQKDQRSFEKQQIPIPSLDRSQDSRRRAKSLNPQTQYARARLLNSIVDKIRQTKRTNFATLGLSEENMKDRISNLQILMKEASMSRDKSERYDDHKQEKLDISDFLKNINEMPNDVSYSSNMNKKEQSKHQINWLQDSSHREKDQSMGDPSRQNNQPKIYRTEYNYNFGRNSTSQDPIFSRYSKPNNNFIPAQNIQSQTNKYHHEQHYKNNHDIQARQSHKQAPNKQMHEDVYSRHSQNRKLASQHQESFNGIEKYHNLFSKTNLQVIGQHRDSFLENVNNHLSERPKSNTQGIRFMYRSPESVSPQAPNMKRNPPINIIAPKPFKSNGMPSPVNANFVHQPQNPKFSVPVSQPSLTQQPKLQQKPSNKEIQKETGIFPLKSPRESNASGANMNSLGFSRYSNRTGDRQENYCPLCGRNCNCPRVST